MKPKAIVLRAAGTNCQYETFFAVRKVGFEVEEVHINELIKKRKFLDNYDFLVIPGGFSGGDYLGAGKLFANKMIFNFGDILIDFVEAEKLVLGICNGFQVLVKTNLLPGFDYNKQECTLAINMSGSFQCEWVKMRVLDSKCIFTQGLEFLEAPIAHGEGRFYATKEVLEKLFSNKQVALQYLNNPNGSLNDIAGICNKKGNVFGMMPHPERNQFWINNPMYDSEPLDRDSEGIKIFENAFNYFKR